MKKLFAIASVMALLLVVVPTASAGTATLSVTPTSGPQGTTFVFTGHGFYPALTPCLGHNVGQVWVYFSMPDGRAVAWGSATPDTAGNIAFAWDTWVGRSADPLYNAITDTYGPGATTSGDFVAVLPGQYTFVATQKYTDYPSGNDVICAEAAVTLTISGNTWVPSSINGQDPNTGVAMPAGTPALTVTFAPGQDQVTNGLDGVFDPALGGLTPRGMFTVIGQNWYNDQMVGCWVTLPVPADTGAFWWSGPGMAAVQNTTNHDVPNSANAMYVGAFHPSGGTFSFTGQTGAYMAQNGSPEFERGVDFGNAGTLPAHEAVHANMPESEEWLTKFGAHRWGWPAGDYAFTCSGIFDGATAAATFRLEPNPSTGAGTATLYVTPTTRSAIRDVLGDFQSNTLFFSGHGFLPSEGINLWISYPWTGGVENYAIDAAVVWDPTTNRHTDIGGNVFFYYRPGSVETNVGVDNRDFSNVPGTNCVTARGVTSQRIAIACFELTGLTPDP